MMIGGKQMKFGERRVKCTGCGLELPGMGPLLCPRCGYIMKDIPSEAIMKRPRKTVTEDSTDGD